MKSCINILGTGSAGNCALVYDSRGKCVILDLGLSWEDVQKGLDYDVSCISAILLTHKHSDHLKGVKEAISRGFSVYGNNDVCSNYNGCNELKMGYALKIDGWKIQTFELVHNVPCNAFIVDTFDGIRILYCTDTVYIPKVVKNVNYAIIECNHDDEYMLDRMLDGKFSASRPEHHQDIFDCIEYLKRIYNPNLQCVVLWHMSDSNIDEKKAVQRVKDELSFSNVVAASKGLVVELNKEEF